MLPLLLLLACGSPDAVPEPTPEAAPPAEAPEPAPSPEEVAMKKAKESAAKLGSTLKSRVIEGLAASGPAATLEMCSQEAQGITALVAGESGARVGRASTKLRNPANAGPEWVQAWLAEVENTPVGEIDPVSEVVDVDGKKVAHFVAPIAIAEPCLLCHGEVSAEVQAKLDASYPEDNATGYTQDQLRGAVWAEVDVGS